MAEEAQAGATGTRCEIFTLAIERTIRTCSHFLAIIVTLRLFGTGLEHCNLCTVVKYTRWLAALCKPYIYSYLYGVVLQINQKENGTLIIICGGLARQ